MPQHSTTILTHLADISNQSGINKFKAIIEDIITQFKQKQLDLVISLVKQHICSISSKIRIIESVVFDITLIKDNIELSFRDYLEQALLQFTKEEEAVIINILQLKELGTRVPKRLANLIHAIVFYELTGMQLYGR
ncbi:MAG: hypothetical protein KBD37_01145 [Burkholderiales bacterium]|nr:hypothetical protein [Burkholderiales bacterium]